MKIAGIFIAASVVSLFILSACNPKAAPAPAPTGPASTSPVGGGTATGWEAEWQKSLIEARKEGKVSVYASLTGPPLREQGPAFKQKFGIDLEITTGRGSEVAQKLIRERAAGIYIADIAISGLNTFFGDIKPVGASIPMERELLLPEVTDPKLWYQKDRLPWADEARHVFSFFAYPNAEIHINTDFIKPGEFQSWRDLLNPRYKGKILWSDPTVSGSGLNGFSTLTYHKVLTPDFYRELMAKQDIQVTRDLRLQVDWLARGKVWLAISAEGTPVAEYLQAGAPLGTVIPKEGTYLSVDGGNMSILSKAPHPYAARVFTNWLLGREGQTMFQKAMKYQSARADLSVEGVNPSNVRQPGVKYFIGANSIEDWVLNEQAKSVALAKELFGPAIGIQ